MHELLIEPDIGMGPEPHWDPVLCTTSTPPPQQFCSGSFKPLRLAECGPNIEAENPCCRYRLVVMRENV
jgi:hypothetical protein